MDDLAQLLTDLLHFEHATAHCFRELVHTHDPGRHGRLDLADHLFDVIGSHRGLVGQTPHFSRHHGKAAAVFAGLFRLDGGIKREQVGLVGDLDDGHHHLIDVAGLLVEDRQLGVDQIGRAHHRMHGFFHARQALLAGTGSHGSLIGGGGNLGHGAHQIPGSGGNLTGGRADFRGGGGGFGGGGLLLLGRRGDLGHRRGHLHRRALGLGHQRSELGHHVVEPGLYRAEFVLALQVQAAAEVAGAHDFEDSHDAVHRRHDRAHQQKTTQPGTNDCDQQRNDHDQLRHRYR
ncbi:hypothetical protein D9M73_146960 [compost metagenome]